MAETRAEISERGLRRFIDEHYDVGRRYDGRVVAVAKTSSHPMLLDERSGRQEWFYDLLIKRRWGRPPEGEGESEPEDFARLEHLVTTVVTTIAVEEMRSEGILIRRLTEGFGPALAIADEHDWPRGEVVKDFQRQERRRAIDEALDRSQQERALNEAAAGFAWVDLAEDWESDPPVPEHLSRSDGACVLYRGQRNLMVGFTESGKSWLVAITIAQEIRTGRPVVYQDFENGEAITRSRLKALGLTQGEVRAHLKYVPLSVPLPSELSRELAEKLFAEGARVMVADALTPISNALSLETHGGNVNHVEEIYALVLDPWAAAGFAALVLDNTPRADKTRSAGSQHKEAAVGGAVISVVSKKKFSRRSPGSSRLYLAKDRSGEAETVEDGELRWWATLQMRPDPALARGVVATLDAPPPEEEITPASVSIADPVDIITQTCELAYQALAKNGLTEVRSISRLTDLMTTVHEIDPGIYPAAHLDRRDVANVLSKLADETLLDAVGLHVEVIATAKATRYQVYRTR